MDMNGSNCDKLDNLLSASLSVNIEREARAFLSQDISGIRDDPKFRSVNYRLPRSLLSPALRRLLSFFLPVSVFPRSENPYGTPLWNGMMTTSAFIFHTVMMRKIIMIPPQNRLRLLIHRPRSNNRHTPPICRAVFTQKRMKAVSCSWIFFIMIVKGTCSSN